MILTKTTLIKCHDGPKAAVAADGAAVGAVVGASTGDRWALDPRIRGVPDEMEEAEEVVATTMRAAATPRAISTTQTLRRRRRRCRGW